MTIPKLSVVICTYDPRPDLLARTLQSIKAQTLPREAWELIIVDNRSNVPLVEAALRADSGLAHLQVLQEARQGLSYARSAGIHRARAPLLVFVDDDNELAPDYLEHAVTIAAENPAIGVFGGIAEPYYEKAPLEWTKPLLVNLGIRDYGPDPIISDKQVWGPWEAIGAGMVCRREVALEFARLVESEETIGRLGRKGNELLSCEDSIIARCANRLGLLNSYQPALKLVHFIKDVRVAPGYLAKLMQGHGISHTRMQRYLGATLPATEVRAAWQNLLGVYQYHYRAGEAGQLQWYWDLGHQQELCGDLGWPLISVVVPTLNAAPTIHRCLTSLRNQNYPRLEVLVVDGNSTDGTMEIIESHGSLVTELIRGSDAGQADALNKGFRRAKGEYCAWLCADDELCVGALFYAVLNLLLNPGCDVFVGGCRRFFPNGHTGETLPSDRTLSQLSIWNPIDQPATLWRKSAHLRAGELDTNLHHALDWEWWNRLRATGASFVHSEVIIACYHFLETSKTSSGGTKQALELFKVMRKYGPKGSAFAFLAIYFCFDLQGCVDSPPAAPLWLRDLHRLVVRLLGRLLSDDIVRAYNWNFASRQARGLGWY